MLRFVHARVYVVLTGLKPVIIEITRVKSVYQPEYWEPSWIAITGQTTAKRLQFLQAVTRSSNNEKIQTNKQLLLLEVGMICRSSLELEKIIRDPNFLCWFMIYRLFIQSWLQIHILISLIRVYALNRWYFDCYIIVIYYMLFDLLNFSDYRNQFFNR